MGWETHVGSQPVDINKKEGEPRLRWKAEPRAWCTFPETEQASLPLSVRDPGTFLETSISIIPKAPGRHLTAWGKARNSNNPQDGCFHAAWMPDSGGKRPGGQQEGRGRRGSQCPPTGNQGEKGTGVFISLIGTRLHRWNCVMRMFRHYF